MFKKSKKTNNEVSSQDTHKAAEIPIDKLNAPPILTNVEPWLTAHLGLPGTASVLAYEPAQRLLAIACNDGRIKLFGREGVEVLLRSPTRAPCKFLEFINNEGRIVHVTTRNDIEVWDLNTRELVSFKKWEVEITGFSVLQGTPFMYLGDETGQVNVLCYDHAHHMLEEMSYTIPAQMTLCGLFDSGDTSAPSVVSILPQPGAVYSRILISYANGLIVLWGLHEVQVLAIRGGTQRQHWKLTEGYHDHGPSDPEEEKEICCVCWACPSGSILAVGYTDGDIFLWSIPVVFKSKGEKLDLTRTPIMRLSLSSDEFKMPVVVMKWSSTSKVDRGPSGFLYVFGGQEMGSAETVTIVPVHSPDSKLQLPLAGPFADVMVLPGSVVLVLTSPGLLNVYEEVDILRINGPPRPIPFKHAMTAASITTARFFSLPPDSPVTGFIYKLPRVVRSYIPSVLPSGTRWPITGGHLDGDISEDPGLYMAGDDSGVIHVWDASTPFQLVATMKNEEARESCITALDFCPISGLLVAGNAEGLAYLYSLGPETTDGIVHFITREDHQTRRGVHLPAGFRSIAILKFHQAAITSVLVATSVSCIAIGDDSGTVSIIDLETLKLVYNDICFANAAAVLSFIAVSRPSSDDETTAKPSSIVFVCSTECDVFALDGSTGKVIASARPKHPSTAISLHLVDSSGSAMSSLSRSDSRKATKQSFLVQVISTDDSGARIDLVPANEEREEDLVEADDWRGPNGLILLCSEDALRIYSTSAFLKGVCTTIRKVRLEKPCRHAKVFQHRINGSGLFILYTTGELEIRSLPDLDLQIETTLSACLNWEIDGTSSRFRDTFSVSSDGRLGAIDGNRELFFMSIFKHEHGLSLPGPYPSLFDRDVAAATEAALSASSHVAAKKKPNQFQDLFGGVMKEIKQSLGGASPGDRSAQELPKLFARQFFPSGSNSRASRTPPMKGSASNSPPIGSPVEEASLDLDIDDIDLEDEDSASPTPSGGSTKKSGVMRKIRNSFKGKKRASSRSPVLDEETERNMLFEGGSKETQEVSKKPAMRTADEIRAAYGHKKAGEASSVAAHARDKLLERQERLQNINRRTEEMQEGAENFASLADELAKTMAARKWWQI